MTLIVTKYILFISVLYALYFSFIYSHTNYLTHFTPGTLVVIAYIYTPYILRTTGEFYSRVSLGKLGV